MAYTLNPEALNRTSFEEFKTAFPETSRDEFYSMKTEAGAGMIPAVSAMGGYPQAAKYKGLGYKPVVYSSPAAPQATIQAGRALWVNPFKTAIADLVAKEKYQIYLESKMPSKYLPEAPASIAQRESEFFLLRPYQAPLAPEERQYYHQTGSDILRELMTGGKATTYTYNRELMGSEFDKFMAQQRAEGVVSPQVTLVDDAGAVVFKGNRTQYVDWRLEQEPTLKETGKEFGLSMIPIYGTYRYWKEARKGGWTKQEIGIMAASIGADILTIVPPIGAVARMATVPSKAVGVGARLSTVGKSAGTLAKLALRSPFAGVRMGWKGLAVEYGRSLAYPFRHPLATAKTWGGLLGGTQRFAFTAAGAASIKGAQKALQGLSQTEAPPSWKRTYYGQFVDFETAPSGKGTIPMYPQEPKKLPAGVSQLGKGTGGQPVIPPEVPDSELQGLRNYTDVIWSKAKTASSPVRRQALEELAKLSERQIATKVATKQAVEIPIQQVVQEGTYPLAKPAPKVTPAPKVSPVPKPTPFTIKPTPVSTPFTNPAVITEAIGFTMPKTQALTLGKIAFPSIATSTVLSPLVRTQRQTELSPLVVAPALPKVQTLIGAIALEELEQHAKRDVEASPVLMPNIWTRAGVGLYPYVYTPTPFVPAPATPPVTPPPGTVPPETEEGGGEPHEGPPLPPLLGFPGIGPSTQALTQGKRLTPLGIWRGQAKIEAPHPLLQRIAVSEVKLTRRYGAVPVKTKRQKSGRIIASRTDGGAPSTGKFYKGFYA